MASHFSGGKVFDRRDELDAGIVDQDIDPAERVIDLLDQGRDLVSLGQVGAIEQHLDAVIGGQSGANFFDFGRIAETVEHDLRALRRQPFAMASPIPLVEPVMSAVLPEREAVDMGLFL